MALRAYEAMRQYYAKRGYSLEGALPVIVFQDSLYVKGCAEPGVFGLYESRSGIIYMLHYDSREFQNARFFGLEPCESVYLSILAHELAHFANARIRRGMGAVTDEYVAAVVQFATMEPELKGEIMKYARTQLFTTSVSRRTYKTSIDAFLISAYVRSRNNPGLLEECLKWDIFEELMPDE